MHLLLVSFAIILIAGAAIADGAAQAKPGGIITANNDFGFALLNQLADQDGSGNTFISPASISICLAMVWNGANGDTKAAMASTLRLQGLDPAAVNQSYSALLNIQQQPGPGIEVNIANSIWIGKGEAFKPEFLQQNQAAFRAELSTLEGAPDTINQWVEEATKGKITKLVDKINRGTLMVLVNAIYFKGQWSSPFDPKDTKPRAFHAPGGSVEVPMMSKSGYFFCAETDAYQAIRLPYGNERFAMIVILPKAGTTLQSIRAGMTAAKWHELTSVMRQKQGEIVLPRLKLEYKAEEPMDKSLKAMGMGIAYTPGAADFSQMIDTSNSDPVCLERVIHKTFLEVNEEGSEAAAATAAFIARSAAPDPSKPFKMVVDRPYLIAITSGDIIDRETGMVLFVGTINDPR